MGSSSWGGLDKFFHARASDDGALICITRLAYAYEACVIKATGVA